MEWVIIGAFVGSLLGFTFTWFKLFRIRGDYDMLLEPDGTKWDMRAFNQGQVARKEKGFAADGFSIASSTGHSTKFGARLWIRVELKKYEKLISRKNAQVLYKTRKGRLRRMSKADTALIVLKPEAENVPEDNYATNPGMFWPYTTTGSGTAVNNSYPVNQTP